METIANAAATVKNAVFGQSTAADTDTTHKADSQPQRSADPTSATRDVTSDTFGASGGSGSKFGTDHSATTMKHETGPSKGLDTGRDVNRDDSFAHSKSEPHRDLDHGRAGIAGGTAGFDDASNKSPLDSSTTSPLDRSSREREPSSPTKHLNDPAPASDTASTDEVRSGYGRVYPEVTSSSSRPTDDKTQHGHHEHHDHHKSQALGAAMLGTGATHHHQDKHHDNVKGGSTLDELHSVNAPPGPTGTAVKMSDGPTNSSRIPTAGVPGMPTSSGPSSSMSPTGHASTARSSGVTDTANAAPSSVQHAMAGSGPGTAVEPSVGAMPKGITSQQHQGADRPTEAPGHHGTGNISFNTGAGGIGSTPERSSSHSHQHGTHDNKDSHFGDRRKSEPLVAPLQPGESSGMPPAQKLRSGPGTGEGTGTKYERSSGLAAEGGDFDAARPGAGREADRLLDEKGVDHPAAHGETAGTAHGTTHDTTHGTTHGTTHDTTHGTTHGQGSNTTGTSTGTSDKPSLGEKLKEKLHLGSHGKH